MNQTLRPKLTQSRPLQKARRDVTHGSKVPNLFTAGFGTPIIDRFDEPNNTERREATHHHKRAARSMTERRQACCSAANWAMRIAGSTTRSQLFRK